MCVYSYINIVSADLPKVITHDNYMCTQRESGDEAIHSPPF